MSAETLSGVLSVIAAIVILVATYWQWTAVGYDGQLPLYRWVRYGLLPVTIAILVAALVLLVVGAFGAGSNTVDSSRVDTNGVDLLGGDTNIWTAVAASVQTFIIFAAAVFAYRQVREAQRTRQEAQRTREEQSRPFVVVDLDISDPPWVFLTVSNLGRTIARRVRIEFEPPLASSFDNRPLTEEQKKAGVSLPPLVPFEVFTEEIESMAPGKVIRTLFDSMFEKWREDLPQSYRVTVRYENDRGRPYTEEMPLGFGAYKNLEYIHRHTIHDVHNQVEKIADAVRRWSAPSGSGIIVVPREEERRERERLREQRMSRARAAAAPGGNQTRPQAGARARLEKVLRDLADRVGAGR